MPISKGRSAKVLPITSLVRKELRIRSLAYLDLETVVIFRGNIGSRDGSHFHVLDVFPHIVRGPNSARVSCLLSSLN